MAKEAPLYDLVLLLREDAEESTRAKILRDVETAITTAGGSVERNDDWGRRPLTYQIRHVPEAEYHLLQFHAPGSLIEELSHTLRITDGVLRFRVIKVTPGTPEPPTSIPVVATAPVAHSGASAAGASAAAATTAGAETPASEAAGAPSADAETAGAGSAAAGTAGAGSAAAETAGAGTPAES